MAIGIGLLLIGSMIMCTSHAWASSPGHPGDIVVLTAPPYDDADAIVDVLEPYARGIEVVDVGPLLGGGEEDIPRRLAKAPDAPDTVVALGAAGLALRRWLPRWETAPRVVFVGVPHEGAVGAEVALMLRLATDLENRRASAGKGRNTGEPSWAQPTGVAGMEYLVTRTHDLFEPLYHRYLVEEGMQLVPEQSGGYMAWLARRYPSRLGDRFSDARPPADGARGEEGLVPGDMPRGYLDYVAARTAARSYFTLARAQDVLVDNILDDVPIGHDVRSLVVDFLRQRAQRFLGEYVIPQAARRAREAGIDWLRRQAGLDVKILHAQLPEHVRIPWSDDSLEIPVYPGGRELPSPRGRVDSILVRAPNWWQLARPGTAGNDWWTTLSSAEYPAGENREVFLPTGGGLGNREEVATAVADALDLEASASGGGLAHWLARGADALFHLVATFRPGNDLSGPATGEAEEMSDPNPVPRIPAEIPSITAIYRNKSTTLRPDRDMGHHRWAWKVDGESRQDPTGGATSGTATVPLREGDETVRAASLTREGEVLREQEWGTDTVEDDRVAFDTVETVEPRIRLAGPRAWVTGRPAQYTVEAIVDDPPEALEDLSVDYCPGDAFVVTWERPGRFSVRAAVTLTYRWRFADGSTRRIRETYSEKMPVQVHATGFEGR